MGTQPCSTHALLPARTGSGCTGAGWGVNAGARQRFFYSAPSGCIATVETALPVRKTTNAAGLWQSSSALSGVAGKKQLKALVLIMHQQKNALITYW